MSCLAIVAVQSIFAPKKKKEKRRERQNSRGGGVVTYTVQQTKNIIRDKHVTVRTEKWQECPIQGPETPDISLKVQTQIDQVYIILHRLDDDLPCLDSRLSYHYDRYSRSK